MEERGILGYVPNTVPTYSVCTCRIFIPLLSLESHLGVCTPYIIKCLPLIGLLYMYLCVMWPMWHTLEVAFFFRAEQSVHKFTMR